ncbi:MAG: hypothetical protein KGI68_14405, partial [Alphaproteobacteria bacterium]|nr:hypothetical protein [Alphaproteobacteria bacterium]
AGQDFVPRTEILADRFDLAGGFDDDNVHAEWCSRGLGALRQDRKPRKPPTVVASWVGGH